MGSIYFDKMILMKPAIICSTVITKQYQNVVNLFTVKYNLQSIRILVKVRAERFYYWFFSVYFTTHFVF